MTDALIGYDLDGTIVANYQMPCVIISGRTFAEYDQTCKQLAQQFPVYVRGVGEYGDREHAGHFKANMINMLGITEFHEDDPVQIDIIASECRNLHIVLHGQAAAIAEYNLSVANL